MEPLYNCMYIYNKYEGNARNEEIIQLKNISEEINVKKKNISDIDNKTLSFI